MKNMETEDDNILSSRACAILIVIVVVAVVTFVAMMIGPDLIAQ